jgi:hypothetical protein
MELPLYRYRSWRQMAAATAPVELIVFSDYV